MTTEFTVANEADLNAAIRAIDVSGSDAATNTAYTIKITAAISLTTDLLALHLPSGSSVIVEGTNGSGAPLVQTIDGNNNQRGFFVYSGAVTLADLSIQNAVAQGGDGADGHFGFSGNGGGGGGGAGIGGGLFIASGGDVTLIDDSFSNDRAVGGNGGGAPGGSGGGGGGGGLGGNGARSDTFPFGDVGGGGGGVGLGANGDAGAGIIPGAAGGGAGVKLGNNPPNLGGASGGGGGGGDQFSGGGGGVGGGNTVPNGAGSGGLAGGGGFGGGGGGGDGSGFGASGGFGGGGGGIDGAGGFGGGGGGEGNNVGNSSGGRAGFGGGHGGPAGIEGMGGGGGLGAGGDIFVQQGGKLLIEGGNLAQGGVTAGSGGKGAPSGQAYGEDIFIQGNQSITLAPPAGQTLTIAGALGNIADMTGSADPSGQKGAGSLVINGAGTVLLNGQSTFTGGILLQQGTLDLISAGPSLPASGSGPITLAAGSDATIQTAGPFPTLPTGFVVEPGATLRIDMQSLLYTAPPVVSGDNGMLTVIANGQTYTASISAPYALRFSATHDAGAGTLIQSLPNSFGGATEAQLNAAIRAIDVGGTEAFANTAYTIAITGSISLTTDLLALNLMSGSSVTIEGTNGGNAQVQQIDGGGVQRGFFVYAGAVTLANLNIANALAEGGTAVGSGGGGGAGLGGGLFVASAGAATLDNVTFSGDAAVGGNGGIGSFSFGGGGGLGGNSGGDISGGGGVGSGVDSTGTAGVAGIIPGAAGGGAALSHGGASGGAGGSATTGRAGGGGVGGADAAAGGAGGFGGGGGGGDNGAPGGFGGGGGGGGPAGIGGFGGGGGGSGAIGGFGAGDGGPGHGGGGGGLGAGGDIFVQQGGSLMIEGGSLAQGTVTAGSGATHGGQAYGDGIFIQGNQTITLAPPGNQTLTINGVIADETGSNDPSGERGTGSLLVTGSGGTVALGGDNIFTGGIQLGTADLVLDNVNAAGSGAITVLPDATATLDIGAAVANTINWSSTATFRFQFDTVGFVQGQSTATYANGKLTYTGPGGSVSVHIAGLANGAEFELVPDFSGGVYVSQAFVSPPCFCGGTRILTGHGEVPVEDLAVGDRVVTLSGEAATITWIGHRRVDCRHHPEPPKVWPVCIAAGAFGGGLPRRDLLLSPDHAVFVDDVLIPVRYLINGTTIAQVEREMVAYYHVELPRHDVLLAEGLAAESYLDAGDRGNFANGGTAVRLHADFASRVWEAQGCAPLVVSGAVLAAVRRRLARRGGKWHALRKNQGRGDRREEGRGGEGRGGERRAR